MYFVVYNKISDTDAVVNSIINLEALPKPENVEGIEVSEIPEVGQQNMFGKVAELRVNLTDNTLYYVYKDRPLTPEEKLQLMEQENQDLKNRIELMQQALDDLLLGGMQ